MAVYEHAKPRGLCWVSFERMLVYEERGGSVTTASCSRRRVLMKGGMKELIRKSVRPPADMFCGRIFYITENS